MALELNARGVGRREAERLLRRRPQEPRRARVIGRGNDPAVCGRHGGHDWRAR